MNLGCEGHGKGRRAELASSDERAKHAGDLKVHSYAYANKKEKRDRYSTLGFTCVALLVRLPRGVAMGVFAAMRALRRTTTGVAFSWSPTREINVNEFDKLNANQTSVTSHRQHGTLLGLMNRDLAGKFGDLFHANRRFL